MYSSGVQGIPLVMKSRLLSAAATDCDEITTTLTSEPFIKTVEWEMLDKRYEAFKAPLSESYNVNFCFQEVLSDVDDELIHCKVLPLPVDPSQVI